MIKFVMERDKQFAARTLYEEILEREYGAKGKGKKATGNEPKRKVEKSTNSLVSPIRNGSGKKSEQERGRSEPKGSLGAEERLIVERVFNSYSENTKIGKNALVKLGKFKRLIFDARLPVSHTMVELLFYGENRHQ